VAAAPSSLRAATLSGGVSGVLDPVNGVYEVTGNITVPAGQTLTLDAGTILKFDPGTTLTVNGALVSNGTALNPVYLTSLSDNSVGGSTGSAVGAAGQWGVVQFNNSTSATQLTQTIIRYGAGLTLSAASPDFEGVVIASMSAAAMTLDMNSFPTGAGNAAFGNTLNGLNLPGGTLSRSGAWGLTGIPYFLHSGEYMVASGLTLTIAPGVTVKSYSSDGSGSRLRVQGTLAAAGTASQPITFTSLRDSTIGGAGGAAAPSGAPSNDVSEVYLDGAGSSGSVLQNVVFRYAGQSSQAAVYLVNSTATVQGCDISRSVDGIRWDGGGATPLIAGNTIHDNSRFGLRSADTNAGPATIRNNVLARNAYYGAYLRAAVEVSGNDFDGNATASNGGTALYVAGGTTLLSSNTFVGNPYWLVQAGAGAFFAGGGNVVSTGNANVGILLAGGTIGTGSWLMTDMPYLLRNGEVVVPAGSTLTIAPGVTVKAYSSDGSGSRLRVQGTLTAIGTAAQPITFTSARDSTVGGVSNAGGNGTPSGAPSNDVSEVYLDGAGSSGSVLQNVVFRYAGQSSQAAVYLVNSTATVQGCDISRSVDGIRWDGGGATPLIAGNTIHDNSRFGLRSADTNAGPATIRNNVLARNAYYGAYLRAAVEVSGNDFDGNATASNGGTALYVAGGTTLLSSNTFVGNPYWLVQAGAGAFFAGGGNVVSTGNANVGILLAGGTIGTGSWLMTDMPYLLRNGEVVVPAGSTLTIAPGVTVKAYSSDGSGSRLRVQGTLTAIGTASQPITFTSVRDSTVGGVSNAGNNGTPAGAAQPGDVSDVYLDGTGSSGSRLENVSLSYGGQGNGADVFFSNSSATIKSSQAKLSSSYGLRVDGASAKPPILATLVTQNPTGIVTNAGAQPEIHGCNIQGNTSVGVQNNDGSVTVNAQSNYWGSASGPHNATSNPGGTGDNVSNNVNFSSYLSAPASFIQPQVTSSQLLNASPARPGTSVSIRVFFNEDMDTAVAPAITYGAAAPYNAYAIVGGTWTTTTTFQATTVLPAALPNGSYTMSITGARDAIANVVTPSLQPFYAIDGTPPNPPTLSSATPRAGGVVALAWQAPTNKAAAVYAVYRATASFTAAAQAVAVTTVTATAYNDLPPADGAYVYAVAARDTAGNESALSNELTAASLRAAPAVPTIAAASFSPSQKQVSLSWNAPSTGTAVSYNVYRSSALVANTAALAAVDSPTLDATYYYQVSAVDAVGNESARSAAVPVIFDVHAPVIQVSGVTNGQYTNTNLTPSIVITDFSPYVSTVTLNGRPFASSPIVYATANQTVPEGGTASVSCSTGAILSFTSVYATSCNNPTNCGSCPIGGTSCAVTYDNAHCGDVAVGCSKDGRLAINCGVTGTTLTQPGTYFLSIQAQDVFANASSSTMSFTIDKASPSLVIVSPVNGLITNQNVSVVFTAVDDLTPAAQIVVTDELGAAVTSPYTISNEGARSLVLTARDLAGNKTSAGASFILDKTPPLTIADLRLTAKSTATAQATLAWTSPHDALSGVAGYTVKTATFPITDASFASAQTLVVSTSPLPEGSTEQYVVTVATGQTRFFAVRSTDAAGNFSAASNSAFWDLDGPVLSGLTPASGAAISRPTTFLLQATDLSGVARIVFSVDGLVVSTAANPPYAFPWATLAYADGAHVVRFDALDVVGNPSSLTANYTLAYQPPAVPVIASPSGTYDTVVPTVTFTGTAEAGTTVQILLNAFPLVSGAADATGHFFLLATLPAEGSFALAAAASDPKGASAPSAAVTVNFNRTAPNPPVALDAMTRPAGHIALTWQPPSGKVPSSYNVYRATAPAMISTITAPSPALRAQAGVTGTAADDLPPQDGLFYYGVTSLDLTGNESAPSNIAPASADRAIPTAAVVFLTTAPPLGPGSFALRLTLSKVLAAPPLLTFTPAGQSPIPLTLSASSPTVWTGTLTVTAAMATGTGTFGFEGSDFAGNVGHTITSGGAAAIDTTPPSAAIALSPASPVKAGPVALTLSLNKPVPAAPSLAFLLANGATVPVTLAGGPAVWTSTLAIQSGTDGTATFSFSAVDALGNAGSALTAGRTFVIETIAPGAPTLLHAASQKAGVVHLTWSAPFSGPPATYSAYRDGVRVAVGLTPLALGAGAYDDLPPVDGTYAYATSAVDAAGNESALSGVVPQVSRRTPPPAPAAFAAALNAFNRIELSWRAGSTETPSGYNLYRATSAFVSLAGAAPVFVSTPPATDTPPSNGPYYYALTSIDFALNESSAFATTQFLWDNAPPVIAISGVQDGKFYNRDLAPTFTVTDPALATATVRGTLDGAGFASGSTISAEGAHVLAVTGANQAGIGSTTTVRFTLDKTPPVIGIAGVSAAQTYNTAPVPVVGVTDANLASVSVALDGAAYTPGTPITANGAHALSVVAADLAGNVASSTVSFIVNLPPAAPSNVALTVADGSGATLAWATSSNVLGYRVYKDGVLKTQGLLGVTSFTDPAYAFDGDHTFAVSAVDLTGQEGAQAQVTMPKVALTLGSYGLTDGNGVTALNRGFFDTIAIAATNASTQARLIGPATLELVGAGQTLSSASAPAASAPAGGAATLSGVLASPASLPDAASLRATVAVAAQLGATARIVKTFPVAARTPSGAVVQLFAEPLVLGTSPKVQVKVNNQGSAALEVLTSPSDVTLQLLTVQGTLLSSVKETQTGNGAATSPSGYYVSVPPGGSALLDAAALSVPPALGTSGQVTATIARTFNGLATGTPLTGPSFQTTQVYSGVTSPPYNATVAADKAVYDQGATVLLTGVAVSTDGTNTLIPGATVQVGVSLRGFDRVASTVTDAAGRYAVTFNPTPAEAGLYTLWASNPAVTNHVPQSSFTIVGFGFQYANFSASLVQNSNVNFSVSLINTGQTRISGLTAAVSSSTAAGVGLTLNPASLPAFLDGGQSAPLSFTASAAPSAALGAANFTATVRDSNGFVRTLPVTASVTPSAAVPVAVPQTFNVGMAAGATRTLTVVLTNQGTQAWTGVTVSSAALPWVSVPGGSALGDVPPGGSVQLNLLVAPPSSLPSQAYASNPLVSVNSTNAAPIPINALITITASGQGAVLYSAINADKPRDAFGNGVGVSNAKGTLTSLDIAGLTFSAAGDANGGVRFVNVPAGRYAAQIAASGFQTQNFTQIIEPGVTSSREVLLPTDVVSYTWTVTPTTIVDQYNINLSITFKTDVPAPVVVADPAVLNFNLPDTGGDVDSQITLTNKGVIAAHNVNVLPNINDPAVTVTVPYAVIPTLSAGQSVVVPFHLHLAHASCHSFQITYSDDYTCAAGVTVTQTPPATNGSAGSCYSVPTTSVGGGGGGGFSTGGTGTGTGSTGVSLAVPASYVSVAIPNPPPPPAAPNSCVPPTNKQPSNCFICDLIASFSDPGGDPRIPETDLSLNVPIFGGSVDFARVYDSQDLSGPSLGPGWMHSFESRVYLRWAAQMFFQSGGGPQGDMVGSGGGGGGGGSGGGATLTTTQSGATSPTASQPIAPDVVAELRTPDGRRLNYIRNADGTFKTPVGETAVLTMSGSTTAPTGYAWTLLDKTVYQYDGSGKLQTVTDRNGNVVTLDYSSGQLVDVKDPNGRVLYTFGYGTNGRLASVTDLAGRAVNFSYAAAPISPYVIAISNTGGGVPMLSQAVGPKGTTAYGYSAFTVPGIASLGNGALVDDSFYTKNSSGIYLVQSSFSDPVISLLTSVTSPNGFTTTFTLGPPQHVVDYSTLAKQQQTGTLASGSGGGGGGAVLASGTSHPTENKGYYTPLTPNGTNSFTIDKHTFGEWYYPQKFWTLSESGPLGTYSMDYTIDELLEQGSTVVTDPRGFKTTHKWKTINGRTVTTDVIDPGNADTAITYDAQNNPTQVTDRAGRTSAFIYDSANQSTQVTDPLGNKAFFSYEPNFHQLSAAVDLRGNSTQFSYDAKGNLTRIQDALNNATQLTYDAHGLARSVSDPLSNSVQIGRDPNGYATSVVDPLNRTANLTYDAQGRVASVADPAGKTTQFSYDTNDDLSQVRDALGGLTQYNYAAGLLSGQRLLTSAVDENGKTTQFGYDSLGRLTSVTNPVNQARAMAYDAANNLTQVTKPDGTVIGFTFDGLGRLTQKNVPGDPVAYGYDAAGNVTNAENNESKIQIAYDANDRPIQVIQTNKAANFTSEVDYQYDANGNRVKTTLQANPAPFTWTNIYDNLDRLVSIIDPQNKTYTFTYDALGRRTSLSYPNGVKAVYSFDAASQITGIVYTNASGVVVSSDYYTYDAAGDPATMIDAAGVHQYAYDGDHRLTAATHSAGSTLPDKNESFSYDLAGNRTGDDVFTGYTYDAADRLQQNSRYSYTYDANGNRTGKTDKTTSAQTSYSWDRLDQLIHIALPGGETIDFKYDPYGRLIEETFSSTNVTTRRFVYAGPNIIAVADASNNLSTMITHGPDNTEPLAFGPTANNYYLHADKLGSVKALTGSIGQVVERVEYAAYGVPTFSDLSGNTHSTSQFGNFYAYTGAEWVVDATLSRHGIRFVDVEIGAFISADPLIHDGLNPFWYARANPVRLVDHSGASASGAVIGGAIGSFAGAILGGGSGLILGPGGVIVGVTWGSEMGAFLGGTAGAVIGGVLPGFPANSPDFPPIIFPPSMWSPFQCLAHGNRPGSYPGNDPKGRLRDPAFRRWFHRVWKKQNIPGNRDATPEELEQAWQDWNNEGRPDAD